MQIDEGISFSGKSTKDKINATEGSALTLTADASVGDIASFYYYFDTNDTHHMLTSVTTQLVKRPT